MITPELLREHAVDISPYDSIIDGCLGCGWNYTFDRNVDTWEAYIQHLERLGQKVEDQELKVWVWGKRFGVYSWESVSFRQPGETDEQAIARGLQRMSDRFPESTPGGEYIYFLATEEEVNG